MKITIFWKIFELHIAQGKLMLMMDTLKLKLINILKTAALKEENNYVVDCAYLNVI